MSADLSPAEFARLAEIVRGDSAIVLETGKEYLVTSRLGSLIRREGLASFGELIARIDAPGGRRLRLAVIDAMTTNETSFFRDGHPWETLRTQLLPALFEARQSTRRVVIWCAAASTGQEPYSLAMTLREHFADVLAEIDVKIVATDLSPSAYARAEAGRFSQLEVNRGLPAMLLAKYFTRAGTEWRISDSVRELVEFRTGNLIDALDWARMPTFDAVFMRNVLIYFDAATKAEIFERVRGRLRPDGFLMLGSAETNLGTNAFDRVQLGRTTVFVPNQLVNPEPRASAFPARARIPALGN